MGIQLLTRFSCDFRLKLPALLDCSGQEPPCLVRRMAHSCDRIFRCQNGHWTETDYPFDPTSESLYYLYSKRRGIEVLQERPDRACSSLVRRDRFDRQMVPQKTEFAPCLFFYDYIEPDRYLCLERQNGPIVCRAEDGTLLWQTEETFSWPGNHWPTVTRDQVEVLDFDRHILSVYSLSGEKLKHWQFPSAFQDAQYSPRLYKKDNSCFLEGFWGDINQYVRFYLDERRETEPLFTVPSDIYFRKCYRHGHKFLYTGECTHGEQYGAVGLLISPEAEGYTERELFFHPISAKDPGGGTIKWIDDEHFYYWDPSTKTTLSCYDTSGHVISQIELPGYFDEEDLIIYQDQTYILSHRDRTGSSGWAESREYSFQYFQTFSP